MVHHLAKVRQPLVAVVEDAHWADDATLDFLTFLARRIGDTRALLVVTYRDDEVGARHRLQVVLGDMAVAVRERTHLAPLSIDAVAVLAAGHPVDVAELHARTGGNPFYVTESIEASTLDVPASVRDAVLARAARLSEPARDTLEALAVMPGGGEIELVDDPAALDECVDHGIVVALGGRVALRHELARLAVVDAIAPARRRLLHRRALTALAGSPDAARLAYPEGLSNRELAARLCITEKTAGHHVSHILAKLGTTSRSEATAVATRLGIVPRVQRRL